MKLRVNGETAGPTLVELLDFAQAAGLKEVVWEKGSRRIAFKRAAAPPSSPAAAPVAETPAPARSKVHAVTSPMVGTFHRAAKDRPPLVLEGSTVTAEQRLAVVEAMQITKDVIAGAAGKIVKICVENGRPVEYGQTLFEIEPAGGNA